MLRITTISQDTATILKLEGKFLEPWIESVQSAYEAARVSGPVSLDLSDLRFACPPALDEIRRLIADGVHIAACSNFIAQLLHLETL